MVNSVVNAVPELGETRQDPGKGVSLMEKGYVPRPIQTSEF